MGDFVPRGYVICASSESIEARLKVCREKRRRLDGEIAELTVLRVQRDQQIRDGLWPAAMCQCGHNADWHSHDGEGDCEHDAFCPCKKFTRRTS